MVETTQEGELSDFSEVDDMEFGTNQTVCDHSDESDWEFPQSPLNTTQSSLVHSQSGEETNVSTSAQDPGTYRSGNFSVAVHI